MDKKATGIVGYIGWIGWLIALLAGDKEGAKFHLNQALILNITSIILGFVTVFGSFFGAIPYIGLILSSPFLLIGWAGNIFVFVCWIMGLIAAINEEEKELPLIGRFRIL